jgi:putative membrane protein
VDPYARSWNLEAVVVLLVAVAYVAWVRRHGAGPWRVVAFLAAMALLLTVAATPLETLAMHYLLTIHLLQNVVLAEWAPLLVVLGIPPALAASLTRSALARRLTSPWVALPVWLGNYFLWHLPWLYDTALENPHPLLHLEHLLYFLTGIAMWWSVFQDEPHHVPAGGRAAYVFAAFVLGSPLGLVLALIPSPLYDFYLDAPERLWGLSPLEDQQLAGIGMAVEQAAVFFAVFAYWFFRFLEEEEHHEEDVDRTLPAA